MNVEVELGTNSLRKVNTALKEHNVYSKYASLPTFQIDVSLLVKIQFDRRI
jgi:hypothetical protein